MKCDCESCQKIIMSNQILVDAAKRSREVLILKPGECLVNSRGERVEATPLPRTFLWLWCRCGARYWTVAGYRGHYALVHILGTP